MLMDCASVFVLSGEDEFEKQQRLNAASSAWNFANLNKDDRKRNIKYFLKDYQRLNPEYTKSDLNDIKQVLKDIIYQKRKLYPDIHVKIQEATIKEHNGKSYVTVASVEAE